MKVLIELYDERPIENVLSTEMFRPDTTILLIPEELKENSSYQKKLQDYIKFRGINTPYLFRAVNMYDTNSVYEELKRLKEEYKDVLIDITGGTDAALFATGKMCADDPSVSVITFSRRKNRYFSIQNADFADEKECNVDYNVESFIRMAGGALRPGRFDNSVLRLYFEYIDDFFHLYLEHKAHWVKTITYIQHISMTPNNKQPSLYASGDKTIRTEEGKVTPNEDLLKALEELGFIHRLEIGEKEVSFEFHDAIIRTWLRDIGAVLELYVYKACVETNVFYDVMCSTIVDWEGDGQQYNVTNEIDVLASKEVTPFFISCKTNAIKTEALNELAVIRDRFGGLMAHAAIVTTTKGGTMMKRRAMELDIHVIDIDILKRHELKQALIAASKKRFDLSGVHYLNR